MSETFAIEALGEDALLLRLGETLDEDLNLRVHALADQIARHAPAWVLDIVPAFASLAICFDPLAFASDVDPCQAARSWLNGLDLQQAQSRERLDARLHEIPVRYGGEFGPDLEAVAEHCQLEPAEVIRRHAAAIYRVGMLGFAAGFPYLLGMDAGLATPRRATPRTRVAAGSVGIGGVQTGIYPREGPGGWQIIGRTAFCLFDHLRDPPAIVGPGDRVRFIDATLDERDAR
ncbi:5-oxoprolinase subunit PxpB [Dokdonella sp.]|uniref:5-oxoprolinase subunit PxpB n=1 Tax=Dokdonella sp. TaxID=2291710 RepID=UPI00352887F8